MNILHINQSDTSGGAAIAGYRLHQGLLAQDINSKLLAGTVNTSSDRVAATPRKRHLEKLTCHITNRLGLNYINHLGTFDILKHNFYHEADVLNFHNLHYEHLFGYFNYLAIPSLTKKKPAVFTLHDMWSFTGHCAYSYDCDRWKIGCGECPYPDIYPSIRKDSTRLEWKLKKWVYNHSNLSIVTPSRWLTEQAKQSILNDFSIQHIPYGIDTEAYKPLDSQQCKALLGISAERNVLMFGADCLNDTRKGGDLLLRVLQSIPTSLKSKITLLTVGDRNEAFSKAVEIQTINLGYINSDRLKSIAYSAADLFVFPTRADNLPLMLQESMACGTPIVSFKVGGVPDLVRPGITGYLAEPENAEDFRNGIVQLIEDQNLRDRMRKNCREIVLQEYPLELQAKRYIEQYSKLLQKL